MSEGGRSWLKYVGFGCLGCLGLIVVVVAFVVWLGWSRAQTEKPEERVLTHQTPPARPEPPAPPKEPRHSSTETLESHAAKTAGKVVLELHEGEFHITPGKAGDPIRVEATYDKSRFSLEESSETLADGLWVYRVVFKKTGSGSSSWFLRAVQGIFSHSATVVRIQIPPDVPIELETSIVQGGAQVDIGGLHLTSGSFHVAMGGLELVASEPLAEPMDRLDIKAEMGGAEFKLLGNASPRVLTVSYSMGGMELDLTGDWRTSSEITLRGSMGGAEVRLPDDVRVEGVPDRTIEPPDTGELKKPTLRFTPDSTFQDVEIR